MKDPRQNIITDYPKLYPRVLYYNLKITNSMIENFFNKFGYKVLQIKNDSKEYEADKLFMPSKYIVLSSNGNDKTFIKLNSVHIYNIDNKFNYGIGFASCKDLYKKWTNYLKLHFDENYSKLVNDVEEIVSEEDLNLSF